MVDCEVRQKRLAQRSINDLFHVIGRVNEGTFGVVFKACYPKDQARWEQNRSNPTEIQKITFLAIKKPKTSREGEGFNKDAVREIALLKELSKHKNIVTLRDVVLNPDPAAGADRGLYLVFDWAEYELCEILRVHRDRGMKPPSERMVKSIMWQILNGISYIHHNWVVHRDLKPSNILIMGKGSEYGTVKIADFGMARLFQQPLRPLHCDGVVVTVWYRAPELLLGAKHYSKAIDMWAIGCIFGELLTNHPMFQGKENKEHKALQEDQLRKIFKVVGTPSEADWAQISELPEWPKAKKMMGDNIETESLEKAIPALKGQPEALQLLRRLFDYDPARRISALDAMKQPYFQKPFPLDNVFQPAALSNDVDRSDSFYGNRNVQSSIPMSEQAPGQGSGHGRANGGQSSVAQKRQSQANGGLPNKNQRR
mmetsp:Transcript_67915/g.162159  ORF Transcript_67915/g.162159 Transcript_67915/m.162159 type:complete len:426 (+) Transcript_67915:159-1436(+)|eukprot:CAMPEP_0180120376 /NCGR_PEP_ID=MMETSP0986-20121125/2488_1 /TAXON_ID=697907 /ORGANISM="non described non described, Strain CCMP2293" /LENGTH=425 /DNA_ID=CAMNT_0022059451 /DNA_START=131 /DNA_END=1408 /DNA_ORIENTATION=+